MEQLLQDEEFMTAIVTLALGLLGLTKLPAWAITLIGQLAPIVVKFVEQTMKDEKPEAKREAAIKGVKERLPVVLRVLPGVDKRVVAAVEAAVNDLPPTKIKPVAPSAAEMKQVFGN